MMRKERPLTAEEFLRKVRDRKPNLELNPFESMIENAFYEEGLLPSHMENPHQFYRELYLRVRSHPKVRQMIQKAAEGWKKVSKDINPNGNYEYIGFLAFLAQALPQIMEHMTEEERRKFQGK